MPRQALPVNKPHPQAATTHLASKKIPFENAWGFWAGNAICNVCHNSTICRVPAGMPGSCDVKRPKARTCLAAISNNHSTTSHLHDAPSRLTYKGFPFRTSWTSWAGSAICNICYISESTEARRESPVCGGLWQIEMQDKDEVINSTLLIGAFTSSAKKFSFLGRKCDVQYFLEDASELNR